MPACSDQVLFGLRKPPELNCSKLQLSVKLKRDVNTLVHILNSSWLLHQHDSQSVTASLSLYYMLRIPSQLPGYGSTGKGQHLSLPAHSATEVKETI